MDCFAVLKLMMFISNGLIFLAGAAILGVGIWVKVDSSSILSFLKIFEHASPDLTQLLNVGYLLIAVGAVLVVIGFLGCFGAIKERRCMLLLFFILVLVVFLAEIVGVVVILVFKPLERAVGEAIGANIVSEYGQNPDITGLWDTAMTTLNCCGFYNASDFLGSPYYITNNHYPPQCCPDLGQELCDDSKINPQKIPGCLPKIKQLIQANTPTVVGVAMGIALLEVCTMAVSMTLFRRIKTRET